MPSGMSRKSPSFQTETIETVNKVAEQMNIVRKLVRIVMEAAKKDKDDGSHLMQLISSGPGMGKTYIVMDELKKCGMKVSRLVPTGVDAFVKELWDHHKDPVIVVDDCDKLLRSEAVINIAKKAWDKERLVIWPTVQAKNNEKHRVRRRNETDEDFEHRRLNRYDPTIPPPIFKIKSRLIWLTNINCTEEQTLADNMAIHFDALVSRGLGPFHIDTEDKEELFRYILDLATRGNMLNNMPGMNIEKTEKVLAWYVKNRNFLKELSPRSMIKTAESFRSNAEELLQHSVLIKDPSKKRDLSEYLPPVFTKGVYEKDEKGKKKCVRPGYWTPAIQLEKREKKPSPAAVRKGFKGTKK